MPQPDLLEHSLTALRLELTAIELRAAKVRRAIAAIEELVPTPTAPIPPPSIEAAPTTPEPEDGARPPLKDAITRILREGPATEMTLAALAEALWQRGWVGGQNGPSIESVRQAVLGLRDKGVLTSRQQEGDKASLWRLKNIPLPPDFPHSLFRSTAEGRVTPMK